MIETEYTTGGMGELCGSLLAGLPEWFGVPQANSDYVKHADEHPGVVASVDGQGIGLTTVVQHGKFAAEVHLMAVSLTITGKGLAGRCSDCWRPSSRLMVWSSCRSRR